MGKTLLANYQDMRERVKVAAKSDVERIIFTAQEQFIKPILCAPLYDRIIAGLENDNLTTLDTALLPYLRDVVIYRAYSMYIPESDVLQFKAGLKKALDDTAQEITPQEKSQMISTTKETAAYYEAQLRNYLCENYENDSLWTDCNPLPKGGFAISGIGGVRKTKVIRPRDIT